MAFTIFPTQADVAPATGGGRVLTEENLHALLKGLSQNSNFLITGGVVSAAGGLDVSISAGEAVIDGYWVKWDAPIVFTMTNGVTRLLMMRVTKTSGRVDGAVVEEATAVNGYSSDVIGVDRVTIASVTTSGGAVVDIGDERSWSPSTVVGRYTGDGTTSRTISLGKTPVLVLVQKSDEGSTTIGTATLAVSAPNLFGIRGFGGAGAPFVVENGFYVVNDDANERTKILESIYVEFASDANFTFVSGEFSRTYAVTGAAVGDIVIPRRDNAMYLFGRVTSSNVVTVDYIQFSGTAFVATSTVRILVMKANTHRKVMMGGSNFGTAGGNIPVIVSGGFKVSTASASVHLNQSGEVYRYVAFM